MENLSSKRSISQVRTERWYLERLWCSFGVVRPRWAGCHFGTALRSVKGYLVDTSSVQEGSLNGHTTNRVSDRSHMPPAEDVNLTLLVALGYEGLATICDMPGQEIPK